MPVMLERWNDDKMDALAAEVTGLGGRVGILEVKVDGLGIKMDERFEQVDKRFEQVDKRFERVEGELHEQRRETKAGFEKIESEMKAGFEGLHRLMLRLWGGLAIALVIAVLVHS